MGTLILKTIVVTCDNELTINMLHALATDLLAPLVTPRMSGKANGFWTFMIVPDGSKLSWPLFAEFEARREAFKDEIENNAWQGFLHVYELRYGECSPEMREVL